MSDPIEASEICHAVLDRIETVVRGKRPALATILASMLARGHILLEDLPGLAKTLTARSFAQVLDLPFARVQFTSDLLPMDISGGEIYKDGEFELRKGPIFTSILLADEINRAPPKTQSSLLEAMEERQVTLSGQTLLLEEPFIVIATQNPIEYEGTYPLPEAQMDRFLTRISFGYPDRSTERDILRLRSDRKQPKVFLEPFLDRSDFLDLQDRVEDVRIDDDLIDYIVTICVSIRAHRDVEVGASPRGSLGLMQMAKAMALLEGRSYVVPDDAKGMAVAVLAHRILLKPDPWMRGVKPRHIVEGRLQEVPVPKVTR